MNSFFVRCFSRSVLAGVVCAVASSAVAEEPKAPPSPEAVAAEVSAAHAVPSLERLQRLARDGRSDPWLVVDVLLARGEGDAASAFAEQTQGPANRGLVAYAGAAAGRATPEARASLVSARQASAPADALAALAPALAAGDTVVGLQARVIQSRALEMLRRLREALDSIAPAVPAARALGWLVYARDASDRASRLAERLGAFDEAVAMRRENLLVHEALGDSHGAARAYGSLGTLQHNFGRYSDALVTLQDAIVRLRAAGDAKSAAYTTAPLALCQLRAGNLPEARRLLLDAIAERSAVQDPVGATYLQGKLGIVHKEAGELEEALHAFQLAYEGMKAAGEDGQADQARTNMAVIHQMRGDSARALEIYEASHQKAIASGDRVGAFTLLVSMAGVHASLGDSATAVRLYVEARDGLKAVGHHAWEARTSSALAGVLSSRGDHVAAFAEYERAHRLQRAIGDTYGALLTRSNLGMLYVHLGDPDRAIRLFEELLPHLEAAGARPDAARVLAALAGAHSFAGDDEQALELEKRALAYHRELGLLPSVRLGLTNIARLHFQRRELDSAAAVMSEAKALAVAAGDVAIHVSAALGLGGVYQLMGRLDEAGRELDEATGLVAGDPWNSAHTMILRNRSGLAIARGRFVEAVSLARQGVEFATARLRGLSEEEGAGGREHLLPLFEAGMDAAARLGDAPALAWFMEQGRAGSLRESLGSRDAIEQATVPKDLLERVVSARRREREALVGWRRAVQTDDRSKMVGARRSVDEAQTALLDASARVQREAKAAASITMGDVDDLATIRRRLSPHEALVLYAIGESVARALVVWNGGERIVELGATSAIEARVEAVLAVGDSSEAQGPAPIEALADLARLIVEPLGLPANLNRVLISPAGFLGYVPFCLLLPDKDLAYVPSATTWGLLSGALAARGTGVLALGDPDYTLSVDQSAVDLRRAGTVTTLLRLPGTRVEAEAVGSTMLLGAAATESGVVAAVSKQARWRAVHFACHGLVYPDRPLLSALALTADGRDDGFFTCLEICSAKISADLVVLSACETARGRIYRGEGIVGLPRAFMFSGSPRVICSLWKVDDLATRDLMIRFYELWNPTGGAPGLPAAAALRAAQAHIRAQPKWSHPYYWAAWSLWGLPE